MRNNNFKRRNQSQSRDRTIHCSCGSEAKLKTKKNYPYGRKSKCERTLAYYCNGCGKIEPVESLNKARSGWK